MRYTNPAPEGTPTLGASLARMQRHLDIAEAGYWGDDVMPTVDEVPAWFAGMTRWRRENKERWLWRKLLRQPPKGRRAAQRQREAS